MPELDRLEQALTALFELYDKSPSVALAGMYKESLLSQLSMGEAVKAVELAFVSKGYGFPKPGDLIDLLRGKSGDRSVEAWRQLQMAVSRAGRYRSVLFHDSKITNAIEALGGWQKVCDWPEEDLKWLRKDFMSLYEKSGNGGPMRSLPGVFELDNAARGFLAHIPKPVEFGVPVIEVTDRMLLEEK